MVTLTPERAHINSLRLAISRTESAHADTLVQLHDARADLAASEVALAIEHAERVRVERDRDETRAQIDRERGSSIAVGDRYREHIDALTKELENVRESRKASDALTAILTELDRVIAGGLVLKTPSEALAFAVRVRALAAPPDEPTS